MDNYKNIENELLRIIIDMIEMNDRFIAVRDESLKRNKGKLTDGENTRFSSGMYAFHINYKQFVYRTFIRILESKIYENNMEIAEFFKFNIKVMEEAFKNMNKSMETVLLDNIKKENNG